MKTNNLQKVKIGLFTIIGIAILFVAIFLIGSQKNLFSSTYTVYGIFKNVGGLQVGNNVRLAGVNVGVVDGINILTDTSVRVDLTLNSAFKKFVKTDSKLSIGTDGFIGDKLVTISPGGPGDAQTAQSGQPLATIPPVDMDKVMAKATNIIDNASTLTANLSEIVAKINNGQGSIGRLLNNDKMAKDMESTVKQAKGTIRSVKTATGTLNEDLKAAQHNFFLKGFFKKKEKAKQDSIKKAKEAAEKAKEAADTTKKKRHGFLGLGGN